METTVAKIVYSPCPPSSKWYTWTYDSYTKEMKFSMYKEI